MVRPAGVSARDRHADRVRAGGRDRRLAPLHRQHHRLLRRAGPHRVLLRQPAGSRGRSPRPATPTSAGCSSRPPGTTAPATWSARPCVTAGSWPPRGTGPRRCRATGACTTAGTPSEPAARSTRDRQRRHRPRAGRLVLVPGRPRGLAPPRPASSTRPVAAARGATRDTAMSSRAIARCATLDPRQADPLLPNSPSCGNQPAHISLTARRQRHAHHRHARRSTRRPPRTSGTGASPCLLTGRPSISATQGPFGTRRGGAKIGGRLTVAAALASSGWAGMRIGCVRCGQTPNRL